LCPTAIGNNGGMEPTDSVVDAAGLMDVAAARAARLWAAAAAAAAAAKICIGTMTQNYQSRTMANRQSSSRLHHAYSALYKVKSLQKDRSKF